MDGQCHHVNGIEHNKPILGNLETYLATFIQIMMSIKTDRRDDRFISTSIAKDPLPAEY